MRALGRGGGRPRTLRHDREPAAAAPHPRLRPARQRCVPAPGRRRATGSRRWIRRRSGRTGADQHGGRRRVRRDGGDERALAAAVPGDGLTDPAGRRASGAHRRLVPDPAPVLGAVTTPGGSLLVLALVLPVAGMLVAFAAGGRHAERIVLATLPLGLLLAVAIVVTLLRAGSPITYLLGGWPPPLGVVLRADSLAAVMLLTTAVVMCAIGVFARAEFGTPPGTEEARASLAFWLLLLAVWAGLATVFLAGDLFTLYVALELLTFSAVPLVCLDGRAEMLAAALRYALFALIGSVLYLVGTVLLYGAHGVLDLVLLSHRIQADPATLVAAALMTVGLLAKTALVPLHL